MIQEIPTQRRVMGGKPVFDVPAKTVINFKSGFAHKLLCDGPTFTAGTACQYSCSFCYVPSAMKKQEPWLKEQGVEGTHEHVVIRRSNANAVAASQLLDAKGRPRFKMDGDTRVIYGSPLVDVAANMDLVRETIDICKTILSLTNWHIRLLSKSNLLPKVAQGLEGFCDSEAAKRRIIYGVSTGTLNDKLAQAFEEGCPLVSKRIQSLHWLQDNGYRTFGMVCPSLPFETWGDYNQFSQYAADAIRTDKCEHVWAEVMNVRGESMTRTCLSLRDGGFNAEADRLTEVSTDKEKWEQYARQTFKAHTYAFGDKLRFLQYVTKDTREWWEKFQEEGAILL